MRCYSHIPQVSVQSRNVNQKNRNVKQILYFYNIRSIFFVYLKPLLSRPFILKHTNYVTRGCCCNAAECQTRAIVLAGWPPLSVTAIRDHCRMPWSL